ncbi:MAG: hypothetical protein K9G63_15845 [Melioribacteraceae bacterium]|nr:hypothetical protein [Melioribacteraceae bacterium]
MYPARLLPQKNCIIIKNIDPTHHLIRGVDFTDEIFDDDGELQADAIELKRVPGFSTNKIPFSVIDDIKFRVTNGEKNKYWNPGDDPAVISDEDYEYLPDRKFFFLKISDIYAVDAKATRYDQKKKHEYEVNLEITVSHKPTISNYWHCEFDLFYKDNDTKNMINPTWQIGGISCVKTTT